jgi:adenosylcobinamide amidohydrolase
MSPELCARREGDRDLAVLVWRFDAPARVISSAPFGGGIGARTWIVNAQVPSDYRRTDTAAQVREIETALSLRGDGVGMLTAADVRARQRASDGGVDVTATVGLGQPTWASAPDEPAELIGTINLVAWVPAALSAAALINAVMTVTEAKVQSLHDAGVPGTGTATDAMTIVCPDDGASEPFGGPRSTWGARLARATYAAVRAGATR